MDDALKSKDQRIQALLDDVVTKQAELDKISRELHGLRVSDLFIFAFRAKDNETMHN